MAAVVQSRCGLQLCLTRRLLPLSLPGRDFNVPVLVDFIAFLWLSLPLAAKFLPTNALGYFHLIQISHPPKLWLDLIYQCKLPPTARPAKHCLFYLFYCNPFFCDNLCQFIAYFSSVFPEKKIFHEARKVYFFNISTVSVCKDVCHQVSWSRYLWELFKYHSLSGFNSGLNTTIER